MAISSGTLTVKRTTYINTRTFLLGFLMTATGDGSGGAISISSDISSYLPQNCIWEVVQAGHSNNDAADRTWNVGLSLTDWEALISGQIAASNESSELNTGTGSYQSSINNYVQPLPVFLGRPLTAAPTISWQGGTNTNTKSYYFWLQLKGTLVTT